VSGGEVGAGYYPESIPKTRESNIVRGITSLTAQNLGTSSLGFIFLGVLLRLLPGTQYGVYSAASISVGIATALSTLGLQYASARYLSILAVDNPTGVSIAARRIILLSLIVTSIVTFGFELVSAPLSIYFTKSVEWTYIFALSGLWVFTTSISLVLQGLLQGLKNYASLAKILFFSKLLMVFFSTLTLVVYRNVSIPIVGWIVYSVVICLWIGKLVSNAFSKKPVMMQHIPEYSQILKYSLPLGVSALLTIVASNADLLVVGGYLSSVTLGVYNTAVMISSVLTYVLVTPLVTALLPELSSALNASELSNGFRLALRFVMLAILPASLVVAAMPRQLLLLFSGGGAYLSGTEPLQIISLFYVFLAIQTVIFALLQATGSTREVFLINVVTTVVDLSISVTTVPHLGIMGAAIARDATAVLGMSVSIVAARRFIAKLDPSRFYLRALLCSLFPFFVIWTLSSYFSQGLLTIIPYSLIAALIFVASLRALRVLSGEDRALLRHVLPRSFNRILRYL